MIELIKDIIKQHYPMMLTCGLTFLVGVGIGGAITDALCRWTQKGERSNETRLDGSGKEISMDGHDKQRDSGRDRSSGR